MERLGNTDEIRNSTARRLSSRPPGYFGKGIGVSIGGNEQPRGLARCPTIRTSPVTTSQIDVDAPAVGRYLRSDLGAASDCNSLPGYDSHDSQMLSEMTRTVEPCFNQLSAVPTSTRCFRTQSQLRKPSRMVPQRIIAWPKSTRVTRTRQMITPRAENTPPAGSTKRACPGCFRR